MYPISRELLDSLQTVIRPELEGKIIVVGGGAPESSWNDAKAGYLLPVIYEDTVVLQPFTRFS